MRDFYHNLMQILLCNNVMSDKDQLQQIDSNTFKVNDKTIKAFEVNNKGLFHIKYKLV